MRGHVYNTTIGYNRSSATVVVVPREVPGLLSLLHMHIVI